MFKKEAYEEHREGKNPLGAVTVVHWFCAGETYQNHVV